MMRCCIATALLLIMETEAFTSVHERLQFLLERWSASAFEFFPLRIKDVHVLLELQ